MSKIVVIVGCAESVENSKNPYVTITFLFFILIKSSEKRLEKKWEKKIEGSDFLFFSFL